MLFERFETGQARALTVNGWAVGEIQRQQWVLQDRALKNGSGSAEIDSGFRELRGLKSRLDEFQQENNLPRTFEKELDINI